MILFKMTSLFFLFFSCLFYFGQKATADISIPQKLSQSLAELKQNVDQLSVSNKSLDLKNEQLRSALKDSQLTFGKLVQENQQLEDSKTKLEKPTSNKTQQISQLNVTVADLDKQGGVLNQRFKEAQDRIIDSQKEDKRLSEQLAQFNKPAEAGSDMPSPEIVQLSEKKQKEKLAMLKMIADSQNHQELLQQKVLDYKKSIPVNDTSKDKGSKKEILEAQIMQLHDEIVQLNTVANNHSKMGWNEDQIHELEASVNNLEKNRDELRDLVKKIQQKTQQMAATQEQVTERVKLQSNISQLKIENRNLKIDFAELQQQMVDLDKRKSSMEALLQN